MPLFGNFGAEVLDNIVAHRQYCRYQTKLLEMK